MTSAPTGVPPVIEPELARRSRDALRAIEHLVTERADAETRMVESRTQKDVKAHAQYEKARQSLVTKYEQLERAERTADEERRRSIVEAGRDAEARAKNEFAVASRRIAAEFEAAREAAKREGARARGVAEAGFESGQQQANQQHAEAYRPIQEAARAADSARERLAHLSETYAEFGLSGEAPPPTRENLGRLQDPGFELVTRVTRIAPSLTLLEGLIIPKSIRGARKAWVFVAAAALLSGGAVLAGLGNVAIGVAAVFGLGLGFVLVIWLRELSRSQLTTLYMPLMQSLADADNLAQHCRDLADTRLREARQRLTEGRNEALRKAGDEQARAIATNESQRDDRLRQINKQFADRTVEAQTTQARAMLEAVEGHPRRMAELKGAAQAAFSQLDTSYQAHREKVRNRFETTWRTVYERWRDGLGGAADALRAVWGEVESFAPAWDDGSDWAERPAPRAVPPVVPFGSVTLDLGTVPRGTADDARLMVGVPTRFTFPALRAFPSAVNLLIEAPPDGRSAALGVLQATMFRLLTALPPGQARFTIIDPIGIGRGFGAFMHLADFDPALVTNQVWTEPSQIEERLSELVAHMEMVAQKYLRNEYATIEDYNAVAGEVAEPYRVLVLADFPSQLGEKALSRLAAIAEGGVPCGVHMVLAADPSKPVPAEFRYEDFRSHFVALSWQSGRFEWDDPDFGRYPFTPESPPAADFATREAQRVGAAAKRASRVEVPFEFIAPASDGLWSEDSRSGIEVALGKAGATKRQVLALGRGTSQHVLVAGRTGSGKSTLLHALITNLALHYGPDEIELYLIDFKKGVEFKVYATHALPHASVVAIESEREFGISVLQRIDEELRRRADQFRAVGVADIQGYRNSPGSPLMPRILLIVDEFQEFFVEEDKLAQEAALLLDRLVRQGRAFGVHVILGSQSLGGAFSLARSTLGQMAVRIALQCSEVDAHLVLSEQNSAARLLSRPGEAIYNDANGALEGNRAFQVVWLSDERREDYLETIRGLTHARPPRLARVPIVFEGDAQVDLADNLELRSRLNAIAWPESPRSGTAWLGEAVAIKGPTECIFRRQGGNHLLIIGQNEDHALGVASSVLVSLAAQFSPSVSDVVRAGACFCVLDGTPEDHPFSGRLSQLAAMLPHRAKVGGLRDVGRALEEIAAEIKRRQEGDGADGPEIFLFLHDLARFRDLRRKEDDFSFSRREEDAGPPDHLDTVLREGPTLGVHIVTWCDTVTNLNRHFTHQQLREFEMRALFQMSPNDSAHLLDAPHASKLGPRRALLSSEEENRLEKFRPYRVPDRDWLEASCRQLRGRSTP